MARETDRRNEHRVRIYRKRIAHLETLLDTVLQTHRTENKDCRVKLMARMDMLQTCRNTIDRLENEIEQRDKEIARLRAVALRVVTAWQSGAITTLGDGDDMPESYMALAALRTALQT